MALLDSEIARIKWHLGYNLLSVGATPYIGVAAVFEQVIQVYLEGTASTTSTTSVSAATTPAPVTLTLLSATGFNPSDKVVIDVDSRQERVTVQSVAGSTISVILTKAHSGTYPVSVEGPDTIVRDILQRCDDAWSAYSTALSSAGLKQLGQGEIEWFEEKGSSGRLGALRATLSRWRTELGSVLGISPRNSGHGGSYELY